MADEKIQTKINKKSWGLDEDELLLRLVSELGTNGCWTLISSRIPNRTGKQCRERYHNHLKPDIKKGGWSREEDDLINQLQLKIGNQWAKIAKFLPGRSDNAVKNRWHVVNRIRATDDTLVELMAIKQSITAEQEKRARPEVPVLSLPTSQACHSCSNADVDLMMSYHSHDAHDHEEIDISSTLAIEVSAPGPAHPVSASIAPFSVESTPRENCSPLDDNILSILEDAVYPPPNQMLRSLKSGRFLSMPHRTDGTSVCKFSTPSANFDSSFIQFNLQYDTADVHEPRIMSLHDFGDDFFANKQKDFETTLLRDTSNASSNFATTVASDDEDRDQYAEDSESSASNPGFTEPGMLDADIDSDFAGSFDFLELELDTFSDGGHTGRSRSSSSKGLELDHMYLLSHANRALAEEEKKLVFPDRKGRSEDHDEDVYAPMMIAPFSNPKWVKASHRSFTNSSLSPSSDSVRQHDSTSSSSSSTGCFSSTCAVRINAGKENDQQEEEEIDCDELSPLRVLCSPLHQNGDGENNRDISGKNIPPQSRAFPQLQHNTPRSPLLNPNVKRRRGQQREAFAMH